MILKALSSLAHQSGAVLSDSPAFYRPIRIRSREYRLIKAVESSLVGSADDRVSEMVAPVGGSPDSCRQLYWFFAMDRTYEC